jgi:O-antigen ligase
MIQNKVHKRVQGLALALTLFTFPFRPFLINNIFVIIFALNWAIQGNLTLRLRLLAKNRTALLFIGLFTIILVGYFASENKLQASIILEKNIFMLVIPIMLSTSIITKSEVRTSLYSFTAGCLLAIVICLAKAVYNYYTTGLTYHFFYHNLSEGGIGLHAVYFSFYLAFCVLFLMLELKTNWRGQDWKIRIWHLVLISIYCVFIILLSSKTVIIGLVLFVNLLVLFWAFNEKRRGFNIVAIVIINFLIIVGIFKLNVVKDRFRDSLNSNIEFIKNDNYSELTVFTGVTIRLAIWKFIVEILEENNSWWIGMAPGDGVETLRKKAVEKNLYQGNKERGWVDYTSYNAHNQYFQYLLFFGVAGLTYFMLLLLNIIIHALHYRNLLLLFGILLFMMFAATESVLESNKGIIFFSIIPILLIAGDLSCPEDQKKPRIS